MSANLAPVSVKFLSPETKESGQVKGSIYRAYLSASGSASLWFLVLILLITAQSSGILTGAWLSWFVDDTFRWRAARYAEGYALLVVLQSVLTWAYLTSSSIMGLKASDALFQAAVKRVLAAPMSLFTVIPTGRLINLFSNDVNLLDTGVNDTIQSFLLLAGIAFTTLLLVCVNFPAVSTSSSSMPDLQ